MTDEPDVEITKINYENEVYSPRYSEDGFDSFEDSPRRIEDENELSEVPPREGEDISYPRISVSRNSEEEDTLTEFSQCEMEDMFSQEASGEQRGGQEPSPRSSKTKTESLEPPPGSIKIKYKIREPTSLSILAYGRELKEPPRLPLVAVHLELIRREGNALLRKSDVASAFNRYSVCITQGEFALLDPSTSQVCKRLVKKIIKLSYSSRAQLMLGARMWDGALLDSGRALRLDPYHVKSLFSRGKALHALQQFKQACQAFSAALDRNPNDMQVAAALHESLKSHHQSVSGDYDISHFLLYGQPPPECSDYVGPVEIRESPYAGRGLYVTQRVEAGCLLLVTNALAIASTPSTNTQADLSVKLAGMIMNLGKASKKWEHQVYYLSGGKPEQEKLSVPDMTLFIPGSDWSPDPEKNVHLSFIDVVKKVTLNTFDASRALFDGLKVEAEGQPNSTISSGVWILPSFLNHSCIPNTGITFVGRVIFLRASRDLEVGEELTTSYTACSNPNRKKSILKWNFECHCERCQHDHIVEPYFKDLRKELDDYCSVFSSKKSTKAERLRALFRSADMVERVEEAIQSLPIELNAQKKNWVRLSFMVVYNNNMQVTRVGSDLNKKIQTLQRIAEIEESINGGGVYYASMRTSAQLLRYMQRKVAKDTDEYCATLKQVMKVFKVALGDMGEIFFLKLIRHRFSKNKSGEIVWLDYTK